MSGKIKKAEEFVYAAVTAGELVIHQNGEIWRVAKRTGDGRGGVRSAACTPTRADRIGTMGYRTVRAMIDGKRMTALSHRLVWLHFNGPIPDGLTVNHKNGVKHDNRPDNLELATDSEQLLHATHVLKRGRAAHQSGMQNHAAKLTAEQVTEIRAARQMGTPLLTIAAKYEITFQHVSAIARGKTRLAG